MALELIEKYLHKIYQLNKNKGTSPIKVQQLYELNEELRKLIEQLEADGHNTDLIVRKMKEKLEKQYSYDKLLVYVDGAARNNNDVNLPNASGIAFIIYGDSQLIHKEAKYLGSTVNLPRLRNEDLSEELVTVPATGNTVEYIALIEALEYLLANELNAKEIEVFSDSRMVVTQVNMEARTRATHLIRLRDCTQQLLEDFENMSLIRVPREQNTLADALVNEMLDEVELESQNQKAEKTCNLEN